MTATSSSMTVLFLFLLSLAGKRKLNRLELTPLDAGAVAAEIILEVDATNAG